MDKKPISIMIEDAKKTIAQTIVNCQLPPAIMEMVMKELYAEVQNIALQQLEKDMTEYNKEEQQTKEE